MSRKSPLKRKRTSSARRKMISAKTAVPVRSRRIYKGAVSRFTPLLKPFVPGLTVVLIAGVIGTVLAYHRHLS